MNQNLLNRDLIEAAKVGDHERVKKLLPMKSIHGFTRGADVRAKNDEALRRAAYKGHTKTVQVLLQAGANIHAENDEALRWAARRGHTETVRVLLQARSTNGFTQGADVYAEDNYALHWAAARGHTETVRVLLQAGADVHALNNYAETVQALLRAGAHYEILSLLDLKNFLTPKFLLSLPNEIVARIENCHPAVKKYEWCEKKIV